MTKLKSRPWIAAAILIAAAAMAAAGIAPETIERLVMAAFDFLTMQAE